MPYYPPCGASFVSVAPTDASAATSATYVMAGFGVAGAGGGWSLTPQVTGRILLVASFVLTSGATGATCTVQLSFGTGAAPANAAAVAGTQQGGQPFFTSLTGMLTMPLTLVTVITGQAIGTALWFDIAQKSSASTLAVQKANLAAYEF